MKTYQISELSAIDTPVLLPLYEGASIPQEFSQYLTGTEDLDLEAGKLYHILSPKKLLLLGLGKAEELTPKKFRKTIGAAVRSSKKDLCIFIDPASKDGFSIETAAAEAAFAVGFSQYDFTKVGSQPEEKPEISLISSADITAVCRKAQTAAACVNHARDLGNTPSNIMTPEALAEEAANIAKELDLECEILTNKELEEMGAGAILGVNRGSSHGARLIAVKYEGAPGEDYTALVGKGLTFDAGGYNIKTGTHMDGMKFDMCGAANVLCALELIARSRAKANVMAVIGATENKIGPDGYTCNDVLTSLSETLKAVWFYAMPLPGPRSWAPKRSSIWLPLQGPVWQPLAKTIPEYSQIPRLSFRNWKNILRKPRKSSGSFLLMKTSTNRSWKAMWQI